LATPFDEGNCSSYALLEPSTVDLENASRKSGGFRESFLTNLSSDFMANTVGRET
jgi:hypothetical protein